MTIGRLNNIKHVDLQKSLGVRRHFRLGVGQTVLDAEAVQNVDRYKIVGTSFYFLMALFVMGDKVCRCFPFQD